MPNDPKPETAIAADTRPAAPCDPSAFDPVARQLRELEAELLWIDEYRLQFENKRNSDPAEAERMLFFLRRATESAFRAYHSLLKLLLTGNSLDLSKPLPEGLGNTGRSE